MQLKPLIIVFRDLLLPLSETFIRSQVNSMVRYRAVYSGCRRVPGLDLSDNPVVTPSENILGKIEGALFKTTGLAPRLTGSLRKYRPALLHAHFGQDGAIALPLARSLGIPLVVTFHGYDANLSDATFNQTGSGRRYLRRRGKLKRGAQRFIAVSGFIANKLLAQGFPSEKILVHYIGVDTSRFEPEPGVRRENVVLFVGRLVEKKGCEYLIRAMEAVQKQVADAELVMIGDGPLRDDLEALAKGALKRFRFLGSRASDEIRDWMKRAKVLCAPSIVAESGDAEGLPIVVLEAMASGLPVVGFASAGIPEAVKHRETGYLAPEKDWRKLSEYLSVLLHEGDAWAQFSRAGRERVAKEFDLKRQTAKLEELYEEAIASYGR